MNTTIQRPDFVPFPKIHRYNRTVVVTEKIDGTNAQVVISDDGNHIWAASRNRYITPEQDNAGFAAWVEANREELLKLGPGRHYGEWWGKGIQRRYGLTEKRFSLFNTSRWTDNENRPKCCHVVPILFIGTVDTFDPHAVLNDLKRNGSVAAPGFMNPEGIIVFHAASGTPFKMTLDKNDACKEYVDA